jgi:hypothetical protein
LSTNATCFSAIAELLCRCHTGNPSEEARLYAGFVAAVLLRVVCVSRHDVLAPFVGVGEPRRGGRMLYRCRPYSGTAAKPARPTTQS